MLSSVRVGINSGSALIERSFDIPGYIPFVGSVTGALRFKLAMAQCITSIAATIILALGRLHNAVVDYYSLSSRKLSNDTLSELRQLALDNRSNGTGNLGRALIEMTPFLNLALIRYDLEKIKINSRSDCLPKVISTDLNVPLIAPYVAKEEILGSA